MDTKLLFGMTALLLIGFMGFIVADGSTRTARAYEGTVAVADCGPAGCEAYGIDEKLAANANNAQGNKAPAANPGEVQSVSLRATPYGYDKASITVKAGVPVKFDFTADARAGCGRQLIIDRVGVNLVSRSGETVSATFTPPSPGNYPYHCAMNMFRGVLIAT